MKVDVKLLRSMWKGIEDGNEETAAKAAEYINSLSKVANSRMKGLEKIGYDFYDYDRAYTVLQDWNYKRFKTTWNAKSVQENYDMFREFSNAVVVFTKAKSTPAQIKERSRKRADWLLEESIKRIKDWSPNDYDSPALRRYNRLLHPSSETERKNRREFERLISAGPLSELVSYGYGNTDETVDAAIYAIEKGASTSEINQLIDAYMENLQVAGKKMYIEDVWKVMRNNKWRKQSD